MQLILKDFTANFSKYVFITDNLRPDTWQSKNYVLSLQWFVNNNSGWKQTGGIKSLLKMFFIFSPNDRIQLEVSSGLRLGVEGLY